MKELENKSIFDWEVYKRNLIKKTKIVNKIKDILPHLNKEEGKGESDS